MDSLTYAVAEELVVMNQPDKDQMRHILEGLLAHYFSVHCNSYNDGDMKFFLKMANQQRRWLATYGMDDVVGVSYYRSL